MYTTSYGKRLTKSRRTSSSLTPGGRDPTAGFDSIRRRAVSIAAINSSPSPTRCASYHRERRPSSRRLPPDQSEVVGSTLTELAPDAVADFRPGLSGVVPGSCSRSTTLDLSGPSSLCVRVGGPIQACKQFRRTLCSPGEVELQGLLRDFLRRLAHVRLAGGRPANKARQPTASHLDSP